ncbi:MAG: ABC transporter ATP-binding protein [Verrucomicrobiaceae bacterium]|nr:MAG: ABC transporter ATP-binding protein [Verrucomicrobiaceae bacterium]
MSTLFRILRYTARYRLRTLLALLLAVSGTLLVVVMPMSLKTFMDDIIPNKKFDAILPASLVVIGAIALRQVIFTARTLSNNAFEQVVVHDLRRELYDKIQRLPMRWFDNQPTGDIMTRVGSDVPAIEKVIVDTIDQALSGLLQFGIVLGYLLWLHPGLTAVTLAPMPLIAVATWIYSRRNEARYKAASEAGSALHSMLHDNIAGIRQIKAYTVEPEELLRFDRFSAAVRQAQLNVAKANAFTWPAVSWIAESGIVAMMAASAYWILKGEMEVGTLGAFLISWGYLFDPLSRIGPLTQTFVGGVVSGKRVFSILDLHDEVNLTEGLRPEHLHGHVRFENVSFSYAEKAPTVSGINLEALPGQTIALVGPTGAGKSTLLNLLTRFYECDEGRILMDGIPLTELSKEWLRDHIGYVTQESFLFNASVRENLLLAKPGATEEELWDALRAANADGFVSRLEQGLDTITGERGTRLSGGERQRLSIARALLKNPPILLLDEATSAVDNTTEKLIQQALDRLRSHRTSFVIAHRLSTVRDAHRICVLEHGHVVESGRHEELIARGGLYAKLCATGFPEQKTLPVEPQK